MYPHFLDDETETKSAQGHQANKEVDLNLGLPVFLLYCTTSSRQGFDGFFWLNLICSDTKVLVLYRDWFCSLLFCDRYIHDLPLLSQFYLQW